MNTRDIGILIRDFIEGRECFEFTEDASGDLIETGFRATVECVDASDPNNLIVTLDNGEAFTVRIIRGARQ
jgi:carbonic anhydrase